jgi:manganese/iron transport system permease protein
VSVLADGYAQRALLTAVLVGALGGLIGVQVVLRRLAFFTTAMTHATFPGAVAAGVLGLNLYLGTGLFGVLAVGLVAWLSTRRGSDAAAAVGVVLAAGFALGVALLSAGAQFTRDLTTFLVGSILTTGPGDLLAITTALVLVAVVLAVTGKELVFAAFDRDGLVAAGYRAGALDLLTLLLVEAAVVALIPAVGTVLSVALIVAPAASARLWCERIGPMTALSVLIGVASAAGGLLIALATDVAAGAAMVLTACLVFGVSLLAAPVTGRRRLRAL